MLDGLAISRGAFRAELGHVEFGVGTTVLAGPNGSGKSTLLAMLAGLVSFKGSVLVCGTSLHQRGTQRLIGYLPQDPEGLEHLRVRDALYYAEALFGCAPLGPDHLARFGIANLAARRIGRLSGGQRRLVYLAIACVHNPPILVLDEPTAGIDASHRSAIRSAIRKLAPGVAVIVASHLPEDVSQLGDRTMVIRDGMIVFDGSNRELVAEYAQGAAPDAASVELALMRLEQAPTKA